MTLKIIFKCNPVDAFYPWNCYNKENTECNDLKAKLKNDKPTDYYPMISYDMISLSTIMIYQYHYIIAKEDAIYTN